MCTLTALRVSFYFLFFKLKLPLESSEAIINTHFIILKLRKYEVRRKIKTEKKNYNNLFDSNTQHMYRKKMVAYNNVNI
jgi:hypothetical protein